jgi:hypothetical protein
MLQQDFAEICCLPGIFGQGMVSWYTEPVREKRAVV